MPAIVEGNTKISGGILDNCASLFDCMGMVMVTDTSSRFWLTNDSTAQLFGFSGADSLHGETIHNLRCPAADYADEFIRQNSRVLATRSEITLFKIMQYANGDQKIQLVKKKPFFNRGELIGVFCQCMEVESTAFRKMAAVLLQADQRYSLDKRPFAIYTVGDVLMETKLSQRELDCLFYLMRGKTMKEIGKFLNISWRTVEGYINNIKHKWHCESKNTLIEYAITHGYLNYIPADLLLVAQTHILYEE